MNFLRSGIIQQFRELLEETTPSASEMAQRLRSVERDIILPVKVVFIGILFYYLYLNLWIEKDVASTRTVTQAIVERFFLIYLIVNVVVAFVLITARRFPLLLVQRVIFTSNFIDGVLLSALTLVTGGFDSMLFWLFLGLIVRNAVSSPLAVPQLILNISASLCYLGAGILDIAVSNDMLEFEEIPRASPVNNPITEPFLLRLCVLWLLTACCYGVQVLLEKKNLADEEAREFTARQQQLGAAGRLAAQIAHQIKNPLSIINNAAFSLQRGLQEGKNPKSALVQTNIIREEVERTDRIITQIMGYGQLAEGKVEKLRLEEELNRAIGQVFPPGAWPGARVRKDFGKHLPSLLMQRNHLSEVLVNLLLNAREAINGKGEVEVSAKMTGETSVLVTIRDSGPGIPQDQFEKIFQPYFTTKERGTGLGLAIVRNNVEMYGGTVHVESELGKGARFLVNFPTRTFMKAKA